ncbi:MAG: hypothetical protein ACMUIE_07460 [Thermoplasmatota archaeon]
MGLEERSDIIRRESLELDELGESLSDNIIYRSTLTQTRVGELNIKEEKKLLCPTCSNPISEKNPRLVCEICGSSNFCSECDKQLTRILTHKGLKLEYDWPLCRKCYRVERDRQILDIDKGNVQYYKKAGGPSETARNITDSLERTDLEPVLETKDPEQVGNICGMMGLILGIISIFFLGFLLGLPAVILGYMARVRGNPLGNYAILTGVLGLASSIFWFFLTGFAVWYL